MEVRTTSIGGEFDYKRRILRVLEHIHGAEGRQLTLT